MNLHERHVPVMRALHDLSDFLLKLKQQYELTTAERRVIVAEWLERDLRFDVNYERGKYDDPK
jgi:hypothetical protein